jgi:hypothetical protein
MVPILDSNGQCSISTLCDFMQENGDDKVYIKDWHFQAYVLFE